ARIVSTGRRIKPCFKACRALGSGTATRPGAIAGWAACAVGLTCDAFPKDKAAAVVPPRANAATAMSGRRMRLFDEAGARAPVGRPADLHFDRAALEDPQFDGFTLFEGIVGGEPASGVRNIRHQNVRIMRRAQREAAQADGPPIGALGERVHRCCSIHNRFWLAFRLPSRGWAGFTTFATVSKAHVRRCEA